MMAFYEDFRKQSHPCIYYMRKNRGSGLCNSPDRCQTFSAILVSVLSVHTAVTVRSAVTVISSQITDCFSPILQCANERSSGGKNFGKGNMNMLPFSILPAPYTPEPPPALKSDGDGFSIIFHEMRNDVGSRCKIRLLDGSFLLAYTKHLRIVSPFLEFPTISRNSRILIIFFPRTHQFHSSTIFRITQHF